MLAGDPAYSIVSLMAGVLCLAIAAFIYWKSPYLKTSHYLTFVLCLGAVGCISDFLLVNSPDQAAAVLIAQMSIFLTVGFAGAILYLISFLPNKKGTGWFIENRGLYMLIVIVSALIPVTMVNNDSLSLSSFGYHLNANIAVLTWLIIVLAYTAVALFKLVAMGIGGRRQENRGQVMFLSFGVCFPFIFMLLDSIGLANDLVMPPLISIGLLISGVVLSFAVLNFKLFVLEPSRETNDSPTVPAPIEAGLRSGQCEMIECKRSEIAYRIFISSVAGGNQGLLISRVHPDQIKERYGLVKTPVLWLAQQPGPDRIDPSSLSILQHTIVDFLQRGSDSIILLDGLEYLVSNNSADKVLKLMYTIRDAVVISGSKLIVPIDPDVLDKRDLALLEREFELMKIVDEPAVQ